MDEGDIGRLDLGFNQQVVFDRHNFHDIHARLDYAAYRGHFHLLDQTGDW